ncbi:VanZ like protein [Bacteroides zoogleoformans]|nr:VanZ like protein [Bacteroides zoogleoformans]
MCIIRLLIESMFFYIIRKYPFSLCVILAVIYLSFFKPPTMEIDSIPGLDKVAHVCMYFGMAGMLWLEFLWAHRSDNQPLWHAWVGALACPVLFSGVVEMLQEYCTTYRGGDWLDFAANTAGAVLASLIAYFVLKPVMMKPGR